VIKSRAVVPVIAFSAAIFSAAFLLFLVQPMVGKQILPWFGGGPSVWTVCLMFYQGTLFMGYLYAHGLIRFFPPLSQRLVHAVVLLLALALLPVLPSDRWRPDGDGDPGSAILILLFVNVFFPLLALAATGPLLQAWFARGYPSRSPYALYAVSNAGSLVALFLFPVVMEPYLSLVRSGELWSLGYLCAATLILIAGVVALRGTYRSGVDPAAPHADEDRHRRSGDAWLWIGLSACAVVLLMAVTNMLCMDVASIPFLWILPLGLYLLTFILCFGSERAYKRSFWIVVALLALFAQYGLSEWLPAPNPIRGFLKSLSVQIPLLGLILFSLCMLLHGELYRLRPPARFLTSFYLAVSGGGALGGLFVGGVAAQIFNDYYEVTTGYLASLALLIFVLARDPGSWLYWHGPRWRVVLALCLAIVVSGVSLEASLEEPVGLRHKQRSFFGVIRVVDWDDERSGARLRMLVHGTTPHGAQLLDEGMQDRPIAYFGLVTGIGIALAQQAAEGAFRLGVLGLGAGTLAAYGREGDEFRFYEIDPVVIEAAGRDGYFSYLSGSEAEIQVVRGDARLSLQRELDAGNRQHFDILAIDCFSSDAIPMHLLTRESMSLYLEHLAPGGLLAFHITNRFFDLEPILYRLASELGLSALTIENRNTGIETALPSRWIFISPDAERILALRSFVESRRVALGQAPQIVRARELPASRYRNSPLWTDDYSSLLGLYFKKGR